jgi:hypothetical protein
MGYLNYALSKIVPFGASAFSDPRVFPMEQNRITEALMTSNAERDPRHQQRVNEIIDHLREDIRKVDEPQLKAMFAAQVPSIGNAFQGKMRHVATRSYPS